jgi:transposase-like protein
MSCIGCVSTAVTERPEVTGRGYPRFRCRDSGRHFTERSGGVLNRIGRPNDVVAFVVFCRLRYRRTLRDLSEILLLRGIEVSHETFRAWEAKLLSVIGDALRKRRHGSRRCSGTSWFSPIFDVWRCSAGRSLSSSSIPRPSAPNAESFTPMQFYTGAAGLPDRFVAGRRDASRESLLPFEWKGSYL